MKTVKKAEQKTYERDRLLTETVMGIIEAVKADGDNALIGLTQKFDNVGLGRVNVTKNEVKRAYGLVPEETVKHITFAANQIKTFATKQLECIKPLSVKSETEGLELGHRLIPVESCGCYIPGGRYPLPSSALMSVAVAKIAGVKRVAACAPPSVEFGGVHPATLVAMDIAGADEIFCMGGAQAVAAFAYGTTTVGAVDLIVGPGNKYVTEAKRQVLGDVGIDSLAGPSEVLIIADETANPAFIAIDLLAQAEHDPNAKLILCCTDMAVIQAAGAELEKQVKKLPTGKIAHRSWLDNGEIYFADNLDEAVALSNSIAPEHLEIQVKNEREVAEKCLHYGSMFVGAYAPVALGDFVSGTNHILPTMSTARFSGGVWVGTFIKVPFHQYVTEQGCRNLSEACMHFAATEGLHAHRESVRLRVEE